MEQPIERQGRGGRRTTACIECQRRKQKCDRQWPCSHCQARNSAHLCQFSAPVNTSGDDKPAEINEPLKKKRNIGFVEISALDSGELETDSNIDAANAVRALGYLECDTFQAITSHQSTSTAPQPGQVPERIQESLRVIPPRPYTDQLVQNFFENVNYHYCILHQPSFMSRYIHWWSRRSQPRPLDNASLTFACLVLRICANSAQSLPFSLRSTLESDFGASVEALAARYQNVAQTLSNFLAPGVGGLTQVQQLFLGATWHKSEAEFVSSWHALGATVREAQEIGMHMDREENNFEKEMKRRVWCALYTWDKFMSVFFNRPPFIQKNPAVPLPNARLDQSSTQPEVPPAIVAKILDNQLATQLSNLVAQSTSPPTGSELCSMVTFIESWLASLPRVFNLHNPDKRWDAEHPRLPFQRLQLYCTGYMTLLMLLRPYLVRPSIDTRGLQTKEEETEARRLLAKAVDTALNTMDCSNEFFRLCFPDKAKYFMVSFCPFDTAALLCSSLLHDKEGVLPRRIDIIERIGTALFIARRLKGLTKMGEATWCVLKKLVSHLKLLPAERTILEELERHGQVVQNSDCPCDSGNVAGESQVDALTNLPALCAG